MLDMARIEVACRRIVVGMAGFEPATPSSRTRCATKLRYIPLSQYYYGGFLSLPSRMLHILGHWVVLV